MNEQEQTPETGTRPLASAEDNRAAALEVAQSARRSLVLLSVDLDPFIYDQEPFLTAVRQLATGSRYASIRVLVQDSARVVREGHRLVELARRLSSFIELRKPHTDYSTLTETFLVADEHVVLYRTLASRFEGIAGRNPLLAREKLKLFNQIWGKSEPDQELRGLKL